MRASVMTAAGLAVSALLGCQPVEEVGRYSVDQTAVFEDGGRRIERTVRVRCRILEYGHANPEDQLSAMPEGPPISLVRGDGSVLLIEGDNPCPWTTAPEAGDTAQLPPDEHLRGLLFDDARDPSRVAQLDFATESDGLRLVSLSVTVGPSADPSGTFEQDFPAWENSDSSAPDYPALMEEGRWVMVWAQAQALGAGACEAERPQAAADLAGLPECVGAPPGPWTPMNGETEAGFRQVDLVDMPAGRRGPDRFPVAAIRRAGGPTLAIGTGVTWAPEVCIPGLCIPGDQVVQGAYILDPEGGRVISVSLSGNHLSSSIASRID